MTSNLNGVQTEYQKPQTQPSDSLPGRDVVMRRPGRIGTHLRDASFRLFVFNEFMGVAVSAVIAAITWAEPLLCSPVVAVTKRRGRATAYRRRAGLGLP